MRKTIAALLTLALAIGLASTVQAQRGRDGQLNLLYWQAPSTMNPNLSGGTKELESASVVLEPLARYDENGKLVAFLAAAIPTVANGGAVTAVAALDPAGSQPAKMALQQNYPNPFNGKTTIAYSVLRDGPVDLAVYDMAGRRVSTLVAAHQLPAHYRVGWDGRDDQGRAVASGVYFYRLSADGQTLARRLVLLK